MLIREPRKRTILVCVCWRYKTGREETKHLPNVDSTSERSRFGRTNIFPWSCVLGLHSKTMPNKQRYCGQLQSHVWIANFRGVNWKTSILRESSYFFVVLWYGRSCEEMCGTILWVGKQDDSTTLQCIYSMHRWPPLQRRRNEICWRIVTSMLSNCAKMFIIGTYWTTWHLVVRDTFGKISHKMDSGLRQKFGSHVGNTAQHCRHGIFQDSDFAGALRIQSQPQEASCVFFGSRTFVPVSWMCKKRTISFS